MEKDTIEPVKKSGAARVFNAIQEGGFSLLLKRAIWVLADKYPLYPPKPMLFGKVLAGHQKMLGEVISDVVVNNQYHIELIKNKGIVVDVGANAGIFSLFVSEIYPEVQIHAFEPTPSTFKILKENTQDRPNIHCFEYGLGDKNEMTSIVETPNPAGNYIGQNGTPCEIKTLDSLHLGEVSFIKIDAEGFEAQVLTGAKETIKRCKPIISMSAYHYPNDKVELPALVNSIIPYTCTLHTDAEEDLVCIPKE